MSWLEHGLGTAYYEILAGKHTNASILTSKRYENAALRRLTRDFGRLKARFSKDSEDFHIDLPTPLSHLNITGFIHDGGVTIPPYEDESSSTSQSANSLQRDNEIILHQLHHSNHKAL